MVQILGPQQLDQLSATDPNGYYSYLNNLPLSNGDWSNYLSNNGLAADTQQTQELVNRAKQHLNTPLVGDDSAMGTFSDLYAHQGDPTWSFSGNAGEPAFKQMSPQELGHNTSWFGENIAPWIFTALGGALSGGLGSALLGPAAAAGSALSGGLGLAGGSTIGAGLGGLGFSGVNAALHGQDFGPLDALQSFGTSAGGSLAGQYFPETLNSLNPFSGSSSNVASGDVGAAFGNLYPGSANVAPSGAFQGGSVPLMGSAQNAGSNDNFFSSLFGGDSTASNVSGASGANISGTQTPSLFDQAGSFLSKPSNLLGLGVAGAGIVGAATAGGESSPSSDLGQSFSQFTPQQQPGLAAPNSLANYTSSALSPDQTLSGIATKGVYGGGNGPEEQKYFLNLVNNRLVDPQGNVGDMNQLNPIENSYLSQLGLGGYGNSTDLLKGISNYHY